MIDYLIKVFKYCFVIHDKNDEVVYKQTRLIEALNIFEAITQIEINLRQEFKTSFIDLLYIRKLD